MKVSLLVKVLVVGVLGTAGSIYMSRNLTVVRTGDQSACPATRLIVDGQPPPPPVPPRLGLVQARPGFEGTPWLTADGQPPPPPRIPSIPPSMNSSWMRS
jgi:hypothetical protein